MPRENWNERLEGTGNGGFAGNIAYGSLASGLRLGYAVTNTNMGMSTPEGTDASIFANRPERWTDWGYRATHEMTAVAKQVVTAYYGRQARRSYFAGCSTGGQQALSEAERFPDDYDGIVAGAPAQNRTGVHMSILWNFSVVEREAAAHLSAAKLLLISTAAVAACDENDGVKDGVITDPRKCRFDPAVLQCPGADNETCLTSPQVETVRRLYAGPANPRTGERIYPGLPVGSEFGWARLSPSPNTDEPPFAPIFKWVFGLHWGWRSFDFERTASVFESKLAGVLNATDPDLDKFRQHGGKLILYHGWADWLVAPEETITYYRTVEARDRRMGTNTRDSARLFMLPGVSHCSGGPGADEVDVLSAIVPWVEQGASPDHLLATKNVDGARAFRRLLCPYPQTAVYHPPGETSSERSYRCENPLPANERNSK